MATKRKLTEDVLTCIVCHEVFTDPVTLHCGHTLCAECVNGYLKKQAKAIASGTIPCPNCRGLTKVPDAQKPVEEWVGQLKTGFFVKSLVETLAASPDAVCLQTHKSQRSSGAAAKKIKPNTRFCAEHAGCPMDMMCEDCDRVLCQKCCIIHHRRCESVITLEQAVTKIDVVLEKELLTLRQRINNLKTGVNLTKTKVELFEESADKAEKDLDATCEKLISMVVANQTQTKEKIARMKESAVQDLQADVKNEEMKLEDAQQKQGLVRQALMSDVPMDHYEMYRICSPEQVEYQATDRPAERVTQIEFSQEKVKKMMKSLQDSGIGDINTTNVASLDSRMQECNNDIIISNDDSVHDKEVSKRKYKFLKNLDTGLKSLCGIVVLTTGNTKVVVCAGYRYVKAFYKEKGKPQHSCLYLESKPKDLFKVSDSKAAVWTEEDSKLVFIKVKPQLEIDTVLKLPRVYRTLAAKTSTTFIAFYFESDSAGTHRGIDTFDMSGRISQSIPVGDNVLYVHYLVVTSNGHITFPCESSVFGLDYQGEQQFEIEDKRYTNTCLCLLEENTKNVCILKTRYDNPPQQGYKGWKAKVSLLVKQDTEIDLLAEGVIENFLHKNKKNSDCN